MTNLEFSNEFDVLYNNITSNQAPGLDEYEKSVFLTKAQDEIVKAYFNPKTNKVQEGFDGNEKRQIDFSMIMRSKAYQRSTAMLNTDFDKLVQNTSLLHSIATVDDSPESSPVLKSPVKLKPVTGVTVPTVSRVDTTKGFIGVSDLSGYMSLVDPSHYIVSNGIIQVDLSEGDTQRIAVGYIDPFLDSFFDMRSNTKAITVEDDILMFINEYAEVNRSGTTVRLTVLPINYTEYSRLMSKPFKRPLKNQAWRLLDNSNGHKRAEIVIGPNDTITKYVIRYVRRPNPIIVGPLDEGTSLDGYVGVDTTGNLTTDLTKASSGAYEACELDPILHPEILQRAVELAKAAYTGDLQSQIALGQASQTNMGIIAQGR